MKRVFVGLSGGVDSAVTAALLQEQGFAVTGVFIKGWYPEGLPCTWVEDRRDAMRVAAHLGIPFQTLDASKEYKEAVIDYLIREYRVGRTPNPDIMCNRDVKFGAFHRFVKEAGADRLATGHYARAEGGQLLRGVDPSKDQSYFLWAVPKAALEDSLFPLGNMHKSGVRKLAERYHLPNARKKDSQGVCFLGSISVDDFLRNEIGSEAGKAYDEEGSEIGRHDGAVLYTLGERIALAGAPPGPWYVVRKDMEANAVTVSRDRKGAGSLGAIRMTNTNWFAEIPHKVSAQYRYHGPLVHGIFAGDTFTPNEVLPEPIASGQSLVLYDGDRCLGGGIAS